MRHKKLSWKIALIIALTVFIVSGALSTIFQIRIITRINEYMEESLRNEISTKAGEHNLPFTDSIYIVKSLRNFAEANFDTDAYRRDAEGYFNREIVPIMEQFVVNTVMRSYFIDGAFFSLHHELSGNRYIGEIFVVRDGYSYILEEPYPYEEYITDGGACMEWFFGAFNSGLPYWTEVYEEIDGEFYVSYVEPVIVNGERVGVVGVDISIYSIKELIGEYQIFDSGFALIRDQFNFFETNDFILDLPSGEKERLVAAANSVNDGNIFETMLGGTSYIGIRNRMVNNYELFILVPKSEYNAENVASTLRFVFLFFPILAVIFVASFFIGKSISKPIITVSEHLGTIASGDYSESLPQSILDIPDETGHLARVSHDLRLRLAYLTDNVKAIAEHDLTGTVKLAFDGDVAGIALNDTIETLNNMFSKFNIMADELQSESAGLAGGSNMLSDGCMEQTKAVDELMNVMNNIVTNNKETVLMLGEALEIERIVKSDAHAGDENMRKLSETVREINDASKGIHKILRSIDDIAFQTNILALNAAVEAARAGQHGKGFAVVADEVRNLAAKSAEAAKETAQLVGVSTQKAEAGQDLVVITAESLSKIISGIDKTEDIIKQIEGNSHKNDADISMVSKELGIVSDITQRTASTAEETAAMSEEMKAQANSLKEIVSVFKIK
jgi:methyl-accepting chemotaxis protein